MLDKGFTGTQVRDSLGAIRQWEVRMATVNAGPEINDLSLLSLLAAHELERLERHEPSDGQYLSALREHLNQQVEPARADIKNIAPSTVELYRRAVRAATSIDPPDYNALINALDSLLNQLRLASETGRKKQQVGSVKSLLAFIISLHGQLLAQKQRSASNRSSNRYRV